MRALRRCLLPAACLLAGCASTPASYHTLVAPLRDAESANDLSTYAIEVAPIAMPAEVDRLELVVRRRDGTIVLLENELWAAPLADELRAALRLGIQDRADSALCERVRRDLRTFAVSMEIERFESVVGDHAVIQARWQLRVTGSGYDVRVARRSRAEESVGPGYASLVDGYQRAIREIASDMADAAAQRLAQDGLSCGAG